MYVFIWMSFVRLQYFILYSFLYLYILLLPTILFVCHFIPPSKVKEGIIYVTVCASYFLHLPSSLCLTFHLRWGIWLWYHIYSKEKPCSFHDEYNHILKLIYWRWFWAMLLVSLVYIFERFLFHIIMVSCHIQLFLCFCLLL